MIIVLQLNNSRSHRVLWLLEELGADYENKRQGAIIEYLVEEWPAAGLAPGPMRPGVFAISIG